jgi:hypothetical protein
VPKRIYNGGKPDPGTVLGRIKQDIESIRESFGGLGARRRQGKYDELMGDAPPPRRRYDNQTTDSNN